MRLRKYLERILIAEIDLFEGKGIAMSGPDPIEPGMLQRRIIIVVEVIDPDDLLAAFQQRLGDR